MYNYKIDTSKIWGDDVIWEKDENDGRSNNNDIIEYRFNIRI